jgi:hypothetical protein
MKMLTTSLAMIATVLGTQASALSCLRPDVARTFQQIAAAEERYVVLLGEFEFRAPPEQSISNDAQGQQVVAQFTGSSLGAAGFVDTAPIELTLQTSCAGPWCGGFPAPETEVLAFVEQTPQGYVLSLGACGGTVFPARTASTVEACMRGERCESGLLSR